MGRILAVIAAGLVCCACSGGISSYEEGIEAQGEIMTEMVSVLEDVSDQASADRAASRIGQLGKRLAEISARLRELPRPSMEELQEIAGKQGTQQREFQQKAASQMMKLAQYKSLSDAWTNALTGMR